MRYIRLLKNLLILYLKFKFFLLKIFITEFVRLQCSSQTSYVLDVKHNWMGNILLALEAYDNLGW
jgi:hypothetical protein